MSTCIRFLMKNLSEDLRLKLDALPNESGVYIMKRRDGQIIYIGKAKSLRDRVRSYFRTSGGDGRRQFKALVRNIADIDYIVTSSEQEALILEATQIPHPQTRATTSCSKTTRNTPISASPSSLSPASSPPAT